MKRLARRGLTRRQRRALRAWVETQIMWAMVREVLVQVGASEVIFNAAEGLFGYHEHMARDELLRALQ